MNHLKEKTLDELSNESLDLQSEDVALGELLHDLREKTLNYQRQKTRVQRRKIEIEQEILERKGEIKRFQGKKKKSAGKKDSDENPEIQKLAKLIEGMSEEEIEALKKPEENRD